MSEKYIGVKELCCNGLVAIEFGDGDAAGQLIPDWDAVRPIQS